MNTMDLFKNYKQFTDGISPKLIKTRPVFIRPAHSSYSQHRLDLYVEKDMTHNDPTFSFKCNVSNVSAILVSTFLKGQSSLYF